MVLIGVYFFFFFGLVGGVVDEGSVFEDAGVELVDEFFYCFFLSDFVTYFLVDVLVFVEDEIELQGEDDKK